MDDNRDNKTDYTPNFIMSDPPEDVTDENVHDHIQDNASNETHDDIIDELESMNRNDGNDSVDTNSTGDEFAQKTPDSEAYGTESNNAYGNAYGNGANPYVNRDTYVGTGGDPRRNFGNNVNNNYNPNYSSNMDEDYNGSYNETAYSAPDITQSPYYKPRRSKKVKKQRVKKESKPVTLTRKSLALLIIVFMLIAVIFGGGSSVLANNLLGINTATSSGSVSKSGKYTLENATNSNLSVSEITKKAQSSVVEIKTESVSSDSWMQQYVTEGAGSGVIIKSNGYIITNNHVIEDASKITVTTQDDKSYKAKVVGSDSNNDIAVLKISAKNLTAATYGNSDQISVGDLAVAIGNPLGELGGTVTSGIISALDRELTIDGKTMNLLQTDSSINPGNSGGGLFNGDGQLIGIVVAKSSGSNVEGLGFAIPINTAAKVASELMDKGYVSGQPTTGMSYSEASGSSSGDQSYGSFFGNDQNSGESNGQNGGSSQSSSSSTVYIAKVNSKTAKKAGFKAGDIVYAVNGKVLTSLDDLSSIVTSKSVGDELTYTIVRDGQTKEITFKLQEKKNK